MADSEPQSELREPRAKRPFVVVRSRGPAWVDARSMEEQKGWPDHAAFMDALTREGLIRLAGPLQGSRDVLLVVLATDMPEIAERFAADPWTRSGLLVLKECRPWEIRLGALPASPTPDSADGATLTRGTDPA